MSEKLENEQTKTTQGLAATTASIKQMDGTISSGDEGTHSRLDAIARVMSIESPAEKQMREQSAEAARAAEARFQELIRLQESGNATEEQVLDAQRAMEEAQQEANEAAEKRSMFDRLSDEDGGPPIPSPPPGTPSGGDDADGGFMKTFGGFFKLLKGFVGILLAVAIPALALILNSPVFEKLKEGLFNLVDFFFEKVIPVITQIKDELLPIFQKLYDNVIEPIKDFFVEFMTKEGGGFDILFEGLKEQFKNFKAIFDDIVNILSALMEGDFAAVKDHILNLGKNILKAITQAIDTFLEFFLTMFGLEKKEGEKGGIDMLKRVMSNLIDSLVESLKSIFESIMSGIQSVVRSIAGDTIGDLVFGKKAVKDLSVEERQEERKELKEELESGDQQKEVEKKRGDVKKAEDELKELEAKAEAAGGFDKIKKSGIGLSQNDIIEAREALQAAKAEEKEAADKLKADQERLKQLEQSLDPQKQLEKPTPPDSKAADAATQAANDNKSNVTIQQNDNSQQSSTEQKTVVEQNKELSGTGSAAALSRAVETAL